jgi:hypothetical protein
MSERKWWQEPKLWDATVAAITATGGFVAVVVFHNNQDAAVATIAFSTGLATWVSRVGSIFAHRRGSEGGA